MPKTRKLHLKYKVQRDIQNIVGGLILTLAVILPVNNYLNSEEVITYAAEKPTTTVTPTPQVEKIITPTPQKNEEVRSYIREVFKEDYDKAMLLLSGNEKCGGENKSLNPKAVNTEGNTPKGSRDIGVFQINEYWQDVNAKFLFDYKINIQIAHKIYKDSGNTFKMWSTGKCIGI